MQRSWFWLRWLMLGMLSGGLLLQTSCATAAAAGTAGLLSSVANSLISNYVYKAMGVSTFSLAGLAT